MAKLSLSNFTQAVKKSADSKDPISELKASGLTSPLIITCAQAIRIKRLVAWLKEKTFNNSDSEFIKYFGSELTKKQSIDQLRSELLNQSLFSKCKLIVVYEADKIKAALAKPLADSIKKGTGDSFLILTGAKINTQTPLLNYLKDSAQILDIKDLSKQELTRWIQQEAKGAGANGIEPQAIKLLVDSYGSDLNTLSNEISKLALLERDISFTLTNELSSKNPEQTSFELFIQLSRKNLAASTKLAKDLLAQGLHPLQLSAFLSRCYRTLIANSDGQKSSSGELSNGWFLSKLSPAKKAFSTEELRKSLEILKEMDRKLKSSSTDEELLFTICVKELALI